MKYLSYINILYKRFYFYIRTELGRKILCNYLHYIRTNSMIWVHGHAWHFAHRIEINEEEQSKYDFLNYIKYPYYINQ